MRIAIATWSNRKVGGTETYVGDVVHRLRARGHDLCLLYETEEPENRDRISLPAETPNWCVKSLGAKAALANLREWQPDVIFSQGLHDPWFETGLLKVAPSVLFAHTYYGTCISGEKTFKRPVMQPCTRRFGAKCLLHYYPHRCGGRSPITMLRLYRTQMRRLANVNRYQAVVTHSSYMRDEFVRQGCNPKRIHNISYYSDRFSIGDKIADRIGASVSELRAVIEASGERPLRLLFLGRMTSLKGGQTLLAALPKTHELLRRPLHVTFAGDGPEQTKWQRRAKQLEAQHPWLTIDFPGWLKGDKLDAAFANTDLLVFPSLWPEPFGLIGLEAGHHGVPIAAFDVGGISDWLFEGLNGHLAPGNPPTADGLADAISKCLSDPRRHKALQRGAMEVAKSFSINSHLNRLLDIFEHIAPPHVVTERQSEAQAEIVGDLARASAA
jgi:glycosyltransferase involved in cell wall biosynthesis